MAVRMRQQLLPHSLLAFFLGKKRKKGYSPAYAVFSTSTSGTVSSKTDLPAGE